MSEWILSIGEMILTGECRVLRENNKKLHDFCLSPNIIVVIKSRKVRWARHVVRVGRGDRYAYKFFVE
jgi:hypothetical protein